jgi:TRAP-type C4-dicarboxylate transport system substrate-binding protein
MNKKVFSILAGVAFAALCSTAASAADYRMRLSHVFPPQHPLGKLATQYAEAVKQETNGKVEVEILGSGQAFAERESYPAVAKGQVDATLLVSVQFSGIVPTVDVLSVPFVMTGVDSAKQFLTSEARTKLDADIREKRVEPLAWLFQTDTSIFTSNAKPIAAPSDLSGLKIRGINKIIDAGLAANGASPLSTPGSEVYQALQSGVLDAALTDVSAALSRRYYEVQKHGTVVPHVITAYGIVLANPAWFAKLPQDVREQVKKAGTKVEQLGIEAGDANVREAIAELKTKGMNLTIISDDKIGDWSKAMTSASKAAYVERTGEAGKAVLPAFDKLGGK